jgi:threonine dehydrogenase-like Zn-dependent dehydrogenase
VLLRFRAAGVCGSDTPAFRRARGKIPGDIGAGAAEQDGFPIHEIVGEVTASRHPDHRHGDQVIGQGSIGLLFSYVAKAAGATHVTGVNPVDREPIGRAFGVDTIVRATSDRWVSHLSPNDRPHIVVEAVGHQVATLGHAVDATAFGGTVLYFGVPDDDCYPISIRRMLRNNLTLKSGVTLDRRRVLATADDFARTHPDLLHNYLTHTFSVADVQAAFDLASRPTPGRIKIAIVE